MRPVEGADHLWYCAKHRMYGALVDKEVADTSERGDTYALPNDVSGMIVGTGDERQGGVVLYVRED